MFIIYTETVFINASDSDILVMDEEIYSALKGRRNFILKKGKATVLVCVTGQRDCDRLIRAGKEISDSRSIPLQVLCVQPTSAGFDANCEELEYLRQTAKNAQAEMSVYFHDDAPLMAVGFAKKIRAEHIVTGMAEAPVNGFVELLHKFLPQTPISMVARDGTVYNICPAKREERPAKKLLYQN